MAYSITTQDGITINNIPDDVAPDAPELKARVAEIRSGKPEQKATPSESPYTIKELQRQAGIAARMPVSAAANVLGLVGDPLNALINLITGSKLQTIGGAAENLMTQAGVPEPRPGLERGLYDIGSATLAAAAPGAIASRTAKEVSNIPAQIAQRLEPAFAAQAPVAASRMFTEAPALQATGAFGATLASQLAAQAGAGPAGQAISGLIGGVAAPGTLATAAGRGGAAAVESVRPFTEAGREVIAGKVLRQLSAEPETAAARASGYTAPVPGYTPTTAQASRDIGLISAETAIRGLDTTGKFAAQQSAANQARMQILDRLAKDQDTLNAAIAKRDAVTAPLREEAFAASTVSPETFKSATVLTVNKTIDDILASPAGKRGTVDKTMNWAKEQISRATTPQELYEVRKDLRDAAQGLLDREGAAFSLAKGQLEKVIRSVDDAIDAAAPGYKDYLDKYRTASQGIDALKSAQEFRSKVLTTIPDPGKKGDFLISQPAFTRAIRAIEKDPETKLSTTQIGVLKRVGADLDDGVLARGAKVPGSDTFKNLSTANIIGGIVGKQVFGELSPALQSKINPFNWLYGGSDEAIREVLVDAMLDPKLASRLMQKAAVTNVEPISKELQRRAINLGYGSIFGLTE